MRASATNVSGPVGILSLLDMATLYIPEESFRSASVAASSLQLRITNGSVSGIRPAPAPAAAAKILQDWNPPGCLAATAAYRREPCKLSLYCDQQELQVPPPPPPLPLHCGSRPCPAVLPPPRTAAVNQPRFPRQLQLPSCTGLVHPLSTSAFQQVVYATSVRKTRARRVWAGEVWRDLEAVWENCRLYNGEGAWADRAAQGLRAHLLRAWPVAGLPPVPAPGDNPRRCPPPRPLCRHSRSAMMRCGSRQPPQPCSAASHRLET